MESFPWDSRTKQMFLREVEIWKAPGDTLGFYVSRGDGHERTDGVFISRLMLGSYVERLGLLQVGDEILCINSIPVGDMPLQNVVMLLKYVQRLVLAVKVSALNVTPLIETPVNWVNISQDLRDRITFWLEIFSVNCVS